MPGLDEWRVRLGEQRDDLRAAEDATARTRWDLARADDLLAEALRAGDHAGVERAADERRAAERAHVDAVRRSEGLRDRVTDRLRDVLDRIGERLGGDHEVELEGVDPAVPIALLPVRLETRFAGPDTAPVLQVRVYPDDLHVDDHEPDLSPEEVEAGKAYWTSLRTDPEDQAWSVLAARLGPYRALWVREQLRPSDPAGDPLAFPDVTLRADGTSRPPVARALPDLFLVRVRAGDWRRTVPGKPVADTLQVGLDLSGVSTPEQVDEGDPAVLGDEVVTLGKGTAWLSDFGAALEAGMAVEVPLPAHTSYVDEVLVTGVCLSLDPDAAGTVVEDLVARHHVTHGAGFVPPGTPTNNLADSTSGWDSRPDPSRLDPSARPAVAGDGNAAVLAQALGLARDGLETLPYAEGRDAAESVVMARALFEATWGPFLRTQAQPGFPLRVLPLVHAHATTWVRGGGPLPAVRLGRQPYGVLPVQPRRPWRPHHGDDELTAWLGEHLPRLRRLWLAGRGSAPTGVAAYSHEPVSSHYRVRTSSSSSARSIFDALGLGDFPGGPGVQDRRLMAELDIGDFLPMFATQRFARDPVDLWLPLADEHDLDFFLVAPNPKEATSVLGLLLRNAALQLSDNLADQLLHPLGDGALLGLAAARTPTLGLDRLTEVAVSTTPEVTVGGMQPLSAKLSARVPDAAGAEVSVQDRIAADVVVGAQVDVARYHHLDAFRTYAGAHRDLGAIPVERRARLAAEVLDCASHRYDAWVTSLATRRLSQLRSSRPTGLQLGAWGVVQGVRRRTPAAVPDRPDLPAGTVQDEANQGFVLAPSLQHADVAGVLRAAWLARSGGLADPTAPFAVDLRSDRLRQALALADGMRNGQQLGALLGYLLERALHDASGVQAGVEVDWAVFELRRLYPLRVESAENADPGLPSERLVVDGWRVAQDVMDGGAPVEDRVMAAAPGGLDVGGCTAAIRQALHGVVGALDALMDLGLAESVHQLAGSSFARAAAATDMVGRAAVPPDAFDVAATPRGGQGIDQRLVVVTVGDERPAGWATGTPRSDLAPQADAFVARRLGPAAGVVVRLLDEKGDEAGRCDLGDLGLSALDLAVDAASQGGASPFPLLLAASRRRTGVDGTLALDPDGDAELVDLLEHAARWHEALAGKRPLSQATFRPRGVDAEVPDTSADGGALEHVLARATALESAAPTDATAALWGLDPRLSAEQRAVVVARRVADARAAADAPTAAKALLGGDAVVTGTVADPTAPWGVDQEVLGVTRGDLAGWVQDTARVRDPARALDEALLHGELRGTDAVALAAGQTPVVAGAVRAGATAAEIEEASRWVGKAFPGALGRQPVVSFVVVHDDGMAADATVTGIEVDAWVEVVPEQGGAGAIAANLASPDSRSPNTILLAVPSDVGAPWTQESLFSVVEEALELAECRLVDLDASRRVPAVLPAIYVSEFDDEVRPWRDVLQHLETFPVRYVAKGEL